MPCSSIYLTHLQLKCGSYSWIIGSNFITEKILNRTDRTIDPKIAINFKKRAYRITGLTVAWQNVISQQGRREAPQLSQNRGHSCENITAMPRGRHCREPWPKLPVFWTRQSLWSSLSWILKSQKDFVVSLKNTTCCFYHCCGRCKLNSEFCGRIELGITLASA